MLKRIQKRFLNAFSHIMAFPFLRSHLDLEMAANAGFVFALDTDAESGFFRKVRRQRMAPKPFLDLTLDLSLEGFAWFHSVKTNFFSIVVHNTTPFFEISLRPDELKSHEYEIKKFLIRKPLNFQTHGIGSEPMKILLLGSGELGRELTISLKRLGQTVVAVDRYANAPAMQMADDFEVIDMLNGDELARVVGKHRPNLIVPEIEAIRTEKLKEFEKQGLTIVPTAEAAHLTMNRDAIRDVAARELKLRTARYAYAESAEELLEKSREIGFPVVIKPVMSSSGKGQSLAKKESEIGASWQYACEGKRGDQTRVIVEEFIPFELEITLLTVKQRKGPTLFVTPIGHRQERGDYQESWMPAKIKSALLKKAQAMAKKVTDRLGGAGIFGVEFFITKNEVIFSELSPRPHDTGMVTLISQDLSEFDLHARAILGLPIPAIHYRGPSASAVILADRDSSSVSYSGLEQALKKPGTDVRIFNKPTSRKYRRMGVALAAGKTTDDARKTATRVARSIKIHYS
jgi:phosphoribosylglycinamide formyltransferase 2